MQKLNEYTKKGATFLVTNREVWYQIPMQDESDWEDRVVPIDDLADLRVELGIEDISLGRYDEITFKAEEWLFEDCEVADQYCRLDPIGQCFACEENTCENCSLIINWFYWGDQRVCHNCIITHTGSDKLVIDHLSRG